MQESENVPEVIKDVEKILENAEISMKYGPDIKPRFWVHQLKFAIAGLARARDALAFGDLRNEKDAMVSARMIDSVMNVIRKCIKSIMEEIDD